MKKFKTIKDKIIIKPADKNLGIVLLDTDDYIKECTTHLADTSTYRLANAYPKQEIIKLIQNVVISFKKHLHDYDKRLYNYLLTQPKNARQPQFYGLPKIHKKFTKVPPVRPIVSQCSSPLTPTAEFIDHVLQPLAQSYQDYIQNSTSLIRILEHTYVPDDAILVSMDVCSLYPSIPQTEMLKIIYQEMISNQHLIAFDPNLIIRLLHINVNYTYFEFGSLTFQQIKGTSMGAPFSPTIANIFMSVSIRKFLHTQSNKPLLIARYIDDIFMIWPHSMDSLQTFINNLNDFDDSINYTSEHSQSTIVFLDLTIFKSPLFPVTNILDIKTFQKPRNLYQYLHYNSYHQKTTLKAIITGELTRYIRTNTMENNFIAMKRLFKKRLLARNYPEQLIDKTMATVKYSSRQQLLQQKELVLHYPFPPMYICLPPPQFKLLQTIILNDYKILQPTLSKPRFITRKFPTLGNQLVRTKLQPTEDQMVDLLFYLQQHNNSSHITAGQLPQFIRGPRTTRCNHPRCYTCQHLNCSSSFTSSRIQKNYHIRHSFNCTSRNLIYLITCRKCKKQYVGLTTQQLNIRINHHRTNILNKKRIYISGHFNFADHNINDLSVQAIDTIDSFQELQKLEQYWIKTLNTIQPLGLNVKEGTN